MEVENNGQVFLIKLGDELPQLIYNHLYSRWILQSTDLDTFTKDAASIRRILKNSFDSITIARDSRVDQKIVSWHESGRAAIYLNSCFINIIDGTQHFELLSKSFLRPVYVVHDLSALEFPEFTYGENDKLHLDRLIAALKLDSKIIAISVAVQKKIQEAASVLGFPQVDISVIHSGINERFLLPEKKIRNEMDKKNQFVVLSTIEPRKNHLLLINIWRKLISTFEQQKVPKLIMIGRRGWNSQHVFDALDKNASFQAHIIEKNNATDEEIIIDIQQSKAVLFPSFDEGWGLPAVESMALGTQVICSDIPVLRECTQGKAIYVDPIDGLGWYQLISQISNSDDVLKVDDFQPVRWAQSVSQLKSLLMTMVDS
jgi:glycosyltransferase involved in cell wall biosynthesis